MTSSTKIADYMGVGLAASIPATPAVPSGGTALYYETDTSLLKVWDGSAWQTGVASGPTAPTLVQSKANCVASSATVTMSAAPTQGNLLVAILCWNGSASSGSVGARWTLAFFAHSGTTDNYAVFIKWAAASESTTQTPYGSVTGSLAVYEYSGARGLSSIGGAVAAIGTSITQAVVTEINACAVCGLFDTVGTTALPTGITGATADTTITNGSNRACAPFHTTISTAGSNNVVASYAVSQTVSSVYAVVI